MSQDDLFVNSRQALLSTDGGASQQMAESSMDLPALDESSDGRWQMAEPMPTDTAVSPQATEGIVNAPTTDRSAGASDRWASAWVTRAIAAELSRLQPFEFRSLRQKANTREVSHTGAWAHFFNKLERCVAAQTRQDLGVANVEHSRRSSACDGKRQGEEQGPWGSCGGKSGRLPAEAETEAVVSALATCVRHESDLVCIGINWPL